MANFRIELIKRYKEAKGIIVDEKQREVFLKKLEKKLSDVPIIGEQLSDILILFSMLKDYFTKRYTDIPVGALVAIIASLLYFISAFDIVPDSIPLIGYFDDLKVIGIALDMVHDDVQKYKEWKENDSLEA